MRHISNKFMVRESVWCCQIVLFRLSGMNTLSPTENTTGLYFTLIYQSSTSGYNLRFLGNLVQFWSYSASSRFQYRNSACHCFRRPGIKYPCITVWPGCLHLLHLHGALGSWGFTFAFADSVAETFRLIWRSSLALSSLFDVFSTINRPCAFSFSHHNCCSR